ncbi:MAG: DUF2141 domain-containing protein [Pseudomonadota bacterium]
MKIQNLLCGAFAALFLMAVPAVAASSDLTVVIKGIKNGNGQILVCLFNRAAGFPGCGRGGAFRSFGTKARAGALSFVLKQLPDGDYAISAAHDQNGDNKIERHFLFGYPTEGAGTSNYTEPPRLPPTFRKARFRLSGGAKSIVIMMHYP